MAVMDDTSSGAYGAYLTCTDSELLAAIAERNRAAFRQFYHRYSGRLLSYVRAMGSGGSRVPTEDIVQEIFVAVWLKASQYRAALGSPEAWLFTITRHKVVDIWRSQNPVVDLGEMDMDVLLEPEQPADSVLALSLAKALGMLTPDQRKPLELAYFGGFTYEETADRLGMPLGTLKSRIRVALSILKDYLGGQA